MRSARLLFDSAKSSADANAQDWEVWNKLDPSERGYSNARLSCSLDTFVECLYQCVRDCDVWPASFETPIAAQLNKLVEGRAQGACSSDSVLSFWEYVDSLERERGRLCTSGGPGTFQTCMRWLNAISAFGSDDDRHYFFPRRTTEKRCDLHETHAQTRHEFFVPCSNFASSAAVEAQAVDPWDFVTWESGVNLVHCDQSLGDGQLCRGTHAQWLTAIQLWKVVSDLVPLQMWTDSRDNVGVFRHIYTTRVDSEYRGS